MFKRAGLLRLETTLARHVMIGLGFIAAIMGVNGFVRPLFYEAPFWPEQLATALITIPFALFAHIMLVVISRVEARTRLLSERDNLTGLASRSHFLTCVEQSLNVAPGLILVVDIDHFKRINDTYGHPAGDRCLQQIADHLRATTRPDDILGRLGGEEFAIFMPGASFAEAQGISTRLCAGIRFHCELTETQVTISAGVAEVQATSDIDRAMSRADRALYKAKRTGRAKMETSPDLMVPPLAYSHSNAPFFHS